MPTLLEKNGIAYSTNMLASSALNFDKYQRYRFLSMRDSKQIFNVDLICETLSFLALLFSARVLAPKNIDKVDWDFFFSLKLFVLTT